MAINMRLFIRSGEGLVSTDCDDQTLISALSEQTLYWGGRALRAELRLADYGIAEFSTLEALDELLGGKKKKKKKAYTTPKKKAHKKKKVKLAVLNLYKVDKNSKVSRTRRVCEKCGPGTFMAKHANRHYCGTCHATVLNKA
jgi:ubiquitin-small subunit ribosomal protein S27Ae